VNTVMNLRVPQNAGKFLNSCTTGSFSKTRLHDVCHYGRCMKGRRECAVGKVGIVRQTAF
jgi:hypothetical protein